MFSILLLSRYLKIICLAFHNCPDIWKLTFAITSINAWMWRHQNTQSIPSHAFEWTEILKNIRYDVESESEISGSTCRCRKSQIVKGKHSIHNLVEQIWAFFPTCGIMVSFVQNAKWTRFIHGSWQVWPIFVTKLHISPLQHWLMGTSLKPHAALALRARHQTFLHL